jgi:glycosyltransferase involved in cell wall biosynthesis
MPDPKVSVIMLTYNHENYICEAIEGCLEQKTNFPYEIIIHDDASTDNTAEIVNEYARNYPDLIFPIFQTENQFSKGLKITAKLLIPIARGKYIAFCEGDDFWTDPQKLQKQVSFLDNNPDFSICCHSVKCRVENSRDWEESGIISATKNHFTLRDLCVGNFIPNVSVFFRNNLIKEFPDWYNLMPMGDWPLHILNAEHGDIWFINEVMGTYRIHKDGRWSLMNQLEKRKKIISAYQIINTHLNSRYEIEIMASVWKNWLVISKLYALEGDFSQSNKYFRKCIKNFHKRGKFPIYEFLKFLLVILFPKLYKMYKKNSFQITLEDKQN